MGKGRILCQRLQGIGIIYLWGGILTRILLALYKMDILSISDWLVKNWLEIAGVLTGVVCVWLNSRENILGWPIGLINVSIYFFIFYSSKLYSDMGLQVVYFITGIYGWYNWSLNKHQETGLKPISRISSTGWLISVVCILFFAAITGYLLSQNTDASVPYIDSLCVGASLIAQFLLARKVLENWLIWIAVNVVYIGLFVYKELYLTAGLYAVFIAIAISGFITWRKSWEKQVSLK